MKKFKWQHIEFINGSNPYICKTEKEFKKMQERYVLEEIRNGFWKATDSISYGVVGFTDKTKIATFHREYKTKASAMNIVRKALREGKFEQIILRREERYLKNNDSLDISSSSLVKVFG